MLLQILRTLEGFSTEFTLMWLQGYVDTNVRCDMVAFNGGGMTIPPLTGQVQVVCTLAANVTLTEVLLHSDVSAKARSTSDVLT